MNICGDIGSLLSTVNKQEVLVTYPEYNVLIFCPKLNCLNHLVARAWQIHGLY